jgi:hypothetical protein
LKGNPPFPVPDKRSDIRQTSVPASIARSGRTTDLQSKTSLQYKQLSRKALPFRPTACSGLRLSLRPWQATCLQNYDTNSFAHKYILHILKKLLINNQQKNNISTIFTLKNIVQQNAVTSNKQCISLKSSTGKSQQKQKCNYITS